MSRILTLHESFEKLSTFEEQTACKNSKQIFNSSDTIEVIVLCFVDIWLYWGGTKQ